MSYDLVLDRDHDLDFDAGQRDGIKRVRQQVTITLLTFLGEWFLDTSWGVPVLDKILIKSPRRAEIEQIIRAKVKAVPNVIHVPVVNVAIDNRTRAAKITMPEIVTDYGNTRLEVTHG